MCVGVCVCVGVVVGFRVCVYVYGYIQLFKYCQNYYIT